MELVFTTKDFRVGTLDVEGFPLLVAPQGLLLQPFFQFSVWYLLHRGSIDSRATWRGYGYSFLQYFRFLEQSQRRWDEPPVAGHPSVLAAYRFWAQRERGNTTETINQRLDLVCKFYQFAHRHGHVAHLPFEFEERSRLNSGVSWNTSHQKFQSQPVADVKFRKKRRVITALTLDQVRNLLGKIPDRTQSLLARLQLGTGLRVAEVASFPIGLVSNPRLHPTTRVFPVRLVPGQVKVKGGAERVIHISRRIMEDLWLYRGAYRATRAGASATQYEELFLTPAGKPYSTNAIWKFIARSSEAAGFKASPHILRHTYATQTLAGLLRSRNIGNALLYVADRLGHSSINTTRVYLHYLGEESIDYMDAYQTDLDELLSDLTNKGTA